MKLNRLLSAAALFVACATQAAPVLTLEPAGGELAGFAGDTVGWGFTLFNDSDEFMLVTGSGFFPAPLSAFGSYADLVGPDFAVLAPHATLTETFDAVLGTGIGSFTFASSAVGRAAGAIELDYALFSSDPNGPNFDPGNDLVTADGQLRAAAGVKAVPEPGSLALLGLAGLVGVATRRRSR